MIRVVTCWLSVLCDLIWIILYTMRNYSLAFYSMYTVIAWGQKAGNNLTRPRRFKAEERARSLHSEISQHKLNHMKCLLNCYCKHQHVLTKARGGEWPFWLFNYLKPKLQFLVFFQLRSRACPSSLWNVRQKECFQRWKQMLSFVLVKLNHLTLNTQ